MSEPLDPFEEDSSLTDAGQQLLIDQYELIHRVFKQTKDGKKLLELWFDHYLMMPIIVPGHPPEAHGIREGKAELVRHIIKTIDIVDNNKPEDGE